MSAVCMCIIVCFNQKSAYDMRMSDGSSDVCYSDLGLPAVRLIDRVADISHVLGHYRQLAMFSLGGALLVIAFVLGLRYGATGTARHLLAPIGGCLLTLATLGALGIPANLFTVLALLLVLGLGVDYSVFLHEGDASRPTTLLAITLAEIGRAHV